MADQLEQLTVVGVDPLTQVPEPVQISSAELQQVIAQRPDILVRALREALERRYAGPSPLGVSVPARPAVTNQTPITELVALQDSTQFSPAVSRLTKGDLMALSGWGGVPRKEPSQLGLTVTDIQTLREVFGRQLNLDFSPQNIDMQLFNNGCCCSPCCCCAVADAPPPPRVVA